MVKRLFSLIFSAKPKRYEKMYRVANDARIHFGELEEQSQDESRELSFQAINTKSAAIVIAAVLEKSKALTVLRTLPVQVGVV